MKNSNRIFRLVSLMFLSVILISCGGGGGGGGGGTGSTAPTVTFTTTGPVTKYLFDTSYTNAATSNSGGAITYSSSDTSVASVDNSGVATLLAPGTTTITATAAAAGSFGSGTANYSLVVENEVAFTAWIGASNSEVTLPTDTSGYTFASARINICTLIGLSSCSTFSYSELLSGATGITLTENTATSTETGYYWLSNGQRESTHATVSYTKFSARYNHQLVVFEDKLWLIAGNEGASSAKKDVWTSPDGKTWTEETISGPLPLNIARQGHQVVNFNNQAGKDGLWLIGGGRDDASARREIYFLNNGSSQWSSQLGCDPCFTTSPTVGLMYHQVVVFNNKLWIIGGKESSPLSNDIWSSSDGEAWTFEGAGAFSAREKHRVIIFNNKFWLIGGQDDTERKNDIWSSDDGVTWTEVTPAASFAAVREDHELVVFNDKLWLIGGWDNGVKNDIWSSADGITWDQITPNLPYPAVFGHEAVVFNNKMWVVGGSLGGINYSNDVWSTTDGINWELEHHGGDFSARQQFGFESFADKLWVIGGDDAATNVKNDVWSSSDGVNWSEETNSASFTARSKFETTVFNNKLWLSAGALNSGQSNEIWSYDESNGWQQTGSLSLVRSGHQMVTFNNEMWILGGYISSSSDDGNWSSSDGELWSPISGGTTSTSAYGDSGFHQAVVYDNKLWVIGGEASPSSRLNSVWYSSDGVNWTDDTASYLPTAYTKHQVVVFDNVMWLIGGEDGTGQASDKVYRYNPANGDWDLQTTTGGFQARHSHRVTVHDGAIYMTGGVDVNDEKLHDVWRSSDGITWRQAFGNTIRFQ